MSYKVLMIYLILWGH